MAILSDLYPVGGVHPPFVVVEAINVSNDNGHSGDTVSQQAVRKPGMKASERSRRRLLKELNIRLDTVG